ncbi:uncharacterized protein STEHIDRAFT_98286 [Stereum hirsutum FP-91666 SS1]|uniref:uncharacterized protein n=1 Tax=Stereum hirsutum (strain FP-91666) TaxID=721885 RepID=UPI000444A7FD|nr:uncharacterized protein STEHIDRAFT_98286 [Stereum hirsutum FP-91666 SS1]EIM85978.1 hypothetical protein STEHIDRAFT_98286 [Stereum hirsutum FP-91666 SS1]
MEPYRSSSPSKSNRPIIYAGIGAVALLFVIYTLFGGPSSVDGPTIHKAVVVLAGDSKVSGTVTFEQASKTGPVTVTGDLKGLDATAQRGFHIHQLGDVTNGCASAGPHFNPFGKSHGSPSDTERHIGDLGNIESDRSGNAEFTFDDSVITLNGPLSIVGRAVVVHAGTDDLGRGDNDESLKTGNAGARSACGVIGVVEFA